MSCQKGMELIFWFGWKVGWESVESGSVDPLGQEGDRVAGSGRGGCPCAWIYPVR